MRNTIFAVHGLYAKSKNENSDLYISCLKKNRHKITTKNGHTTDNEYSFKE